MKSAAPLIAGCTVILLIVVGLDRVSSKNMLPDEQEDLITACKVLKNAAASSNLEREQLNIIVYRNAYGLLRKKVRDKNRISSEDSFFQELEALNRNVDGGVFLSYSAPPRGVGGGWTHNEIDSLLNKIDRGLKPGDIETIIKLKETFEIRDLRQKSVQEQRQKP
jgi:hypothetical protein